ALSFSYALADGIYASNLQLLHWDVPGALVPLFEAFRSSGRFFWPVSYGLVVLAMLGLTGAPRRLQAAITAGILVIQVADVVPIYGIIRQGLERPANIVAELSEWEAVLD